MAKGFIAFFLFLGAFCCSAQTDTSYTDTVIVRQAPLVIEKSVHVTIAEEPKQYSPLELGVYSMFYQNMGSSHEIKTERLWTMGAEVRYHLQNFQIGLGVGLLSGTASGQVTSNVDQVLQKEKMVKDTSDCYTEWLPGGGTRRVCNVEDKQVLVDTTVRSSSTYKQQASLQYLQIPLSIGYMFSKNEWHLTPCFQVGYNKNVSKVLHQLPIKDEFWMAGAQLGLGYSITPHLMVELKAQYQSPLSSIYTTEGLGNWNLLGVGLGIYWHF